MKTLRQTFLVVAALSAATAFSQEAVRSSSSLYLPAYTKADNVVPFAVSAEGKRFSPTWGLDQAWISRQNLRKGVNHMGKENVGIGRTAFRYTQVLTNDSVMGANDISAMRTRSNVFDEVDPQLPLVFTADQEAGNRRQEGARRGVDHHVLLSVGISTDCSSYLVCALKLFMMLTG